MNETYSVGELTRAIGYALGDAFPDDVWITGEISGLNRARGHVYFDLVEPSDEAGAPVTALIPVALFRMNKEVVNRTLKRAGFGIRMDNGVQVRVRGAVAYNERSGRIQVRMTGIDPTYTLGRLALDRERVLRALREEGLLDRNARLAPPLVPLRVGLVTAANSAAYHDFVHELDHSGFAFAVRFVDAKVQGVGAGEQVTRAIRALAATDVDVIAVVRGGGARADLAAFDGEVLARTIATCRVPVLTGVGHEVDRSIADDVAHRAYKTPTACAAGLVHAVRAYRDRVETLWVDIAHVAHEAVQTHDERLRADARGCAQATRALLRHASTQTDNLAARVAREAGHTVARSGARLDRRRDRAVARAEAHLARGASRVERGVHTVRSRAPRELSAAEQRLALTEARLRALDPAHLLARGWSITRTADGTTVRSVGDVTAGAPIVTRLADGEVHSTVAHVAPLPEVEDHG